MKKISLFFIAVFIFLNIVACGGNNNNPNDDDNNNNLSRHLEIVVTDETSINFVNDFAYDVFQVYGGTISIKALGEESDTDYKIIIGESDYNSSNKAYKQLRNLAEEAKTDTIAYAIYSDDGSIALAYTDMLALRLAGDYFVENVANLIPNAPVGILSKESKDLTEYLDDSRKNYRDEKLAEAEKLLGTETVSELKKLLSIYGQEMYVWLANLWDPDTGAFYYSGSARDTIGFLPDLESTAQAFSLIDASGLMANYDDSYANALSEETKNKIVSWVIGLQSAENGYFYHPQWGTKIADAKRGRDLDWATKILTALGTSPLYDTPNGTMKGTIGAPGASPVSLTKRLGASSVIAVSSVVSTSTSGLPAYLKDTVAWRNHLEAMKIDTVGNSYPKGHELASIASQIKNAGKEYVDIFIEFINEKQDPETGLWEPGVTYESVNGLMKISMAIKTVGHNMNYADKALESAMAIALTKEFTPGNEHVCSVYNPWVSMSNVLSSVDKDTREVLRAQIIEKAPELIAATFKKFTTFKKDDGGFSYYADYSATVSQGQTVAVAKTVESDVNATGVSSTSTWSNICGVLGIEKIKLYCPEDGDYFLSLFDGMGTIIKDPIPEYDGPKERVATFTEGVYDTQYLRSSFGIPDGKTATIDKYDEMLEEGFDPITNYDVVSSPTDSANKVLRVIAEKSQLYSAGQTKVSVSNKNPKGDCYAVNFKFYYTDILTSGTVMQIHYRTANGNAVSFNVNADVKNKVLTISENNAAGSGKADVPVVIMPMDEWVELTVEFYKTNVAETTMVKFYVGTEGNEPECLAAINAYLSAGLDSENAIDNVSLAYQRTNGSTIYIDDVSVSQTDKEFTPAPARPEIADFENVNKQGDDIKDYVTNSTMNAEITHVSITQDPTSAVNKVLRVVGKSGSAGGASTYVDVSNPGNLGACYSFETKLYFTGLSSTLREDIVQIFFNDTSSGTASRAVGVAFKPLSTTKVGLYSRNKVDGGTGNADIADENGNLITLNADSWYTLRIEYYAGGTSSTAMTKIYIGEGDAEPTLVAEANIYRDAAITNIDKVHMSWQKYNTEYTVYADDMSFKKSDKAYSPELDYDFEDNPGGTPDVPGNPDTPITPPVSNSAETFDNDDETVYANKNYITHYRVNSGHTAYIDRDPKNEANKVLRIQRVAGGARAELYSQNLITEENANCYVFTTSFYFTTPTNTTAEFMRFTYMSGGVRATSTDVALATKYGEVGKLYFKFGSEYVESTMVANTWYELRLELYDLGSGKGKIKFIVSEGGSEPVSVTEFNLTSDTKAADKMRIWVLEDTAHANSLYFDNVLFASRAIEYTAGSGSSEPTPPSDDPVTPPTVDETYEGFNGSADKYIDKSNKVYYTYTEGGNTPSLAKDPENSANNVLNVQKAAQGEKAQIYAKISDTEENANCYTFETKLCFTKPTNTTAEFMRFTYMGSGTGIANIGLATKYGEIGKVYLKYGSEYIEVAMENSTWYDVKFELIDFGNGTGKVNIYIAKSGEGLARVAELDVASSVKSADMMRILVDKNAHTNSIYLDDMILSGIAQ